MRIDPITRLIMDLNGDRSALTREQQAERGRQEARAMAEEAAKQNNADAEVATWSIRDVLDYMQAHNLTARQYPPDACTCTMSEVDAYNRRAASWHLCGRVDLAEMRSMFAANTNARQRERDRLDVRTRNERAIRAGEPPYGGTDDDRERTERFDESTGPID
jgi:hypothetical protein